MAMTVTWRDVSYLADFALFGVVVDDGLRVVVESLEAFNDRLLVVVNTSARLSAV